MVPCNDISVVRQSSSSFQVFKPLCPAFNSQVHPYLRQEEIKFSLAVWPVQGGNKCQKGCARYYPPHGGKAWKDIASHVGNTSLAGVLKGHKIRFIVL